MTSAKINPERLHGRSSGLPIQQYEARTRALERRAMKRFHIALGASDVEVSLSGVM